MCRLLGVVAAVPAPLSTLLDGDLISFTELSEHHCDGWGHAEWSPDGKLRSEKAPERAAVSVAWLQSLDAAVADAGLLHLRRASPGMVNLAENTHPFTDGAIAFAHNGWVTPVAALDRLLLEHGAEPADGATDSARYFQLVRSLLRREQPEVALALAAELIANVARVEALNALLLTEDALYALCWYDPVVMSENGRAPGLYDLRYAADRGKVVVASTGWDDGSERWLPVPHGGVLELSRRGATPRLHANPLSVTT